MLPIIVYVSDHYATLPYMHTNVHPNATIIVYISDHHMTQPYTRTNVHCNATHHRVHF